MSSIHADFIIGCMLLGRGGVMRIDRYNKAYLDTRHGNGV